MRFADLHSHTTHSDGVRTPPELVEAAASFRIDLLSITDHDSVSALEEARPIAEQLGVTLIPGVELSVAWRGQDVHLLGYGFDTADKTLLAELQGFRDVRDTRGDAMVARLNELGVDIEIERVHEICGDAAFGRPHIARAMVEAGHCESVNEAFDRYLAEGRPAFLPKKRFSADAAIEMVHDAGGVVSLAHPTLYSEPLLAVEELIELGLDGVECFHPKVSPEWSERLAAICRNRGLMATGGSDDHGFEEKRTIGQIRVSENEIGPILERIEAIT